MNSFTRSSDALSIDKNQLEDIVITTDKEGLLTSVNKSFEELTGYTFEEVRGKKPGHFLQGEETNPETVAVMREAIAKEEGFNVNIVNYSKSGEKYWLNINCTPIFNAFKELDYFLAIERNITSEKNKNQEKLNNLLEEQQELIQKNTELAKARYLIAHDLKAPLQNLEGLLRILKGDNAKVKEMMQREITRSKDLIDKILTNTKENTSGEVSVNFKEVAVHAIISNIIALNNKALQQSNLSVSLHCATDLVITTDEVLLTQILENLYTNALKYSEPNTTIIFDVKEVDQSIVLEVSNVTKGLEKWQLNVIFNPFQNFATTNSEESHGMGTYIVKKYTNLLGGTITPHLKENRIYFTIELPKSNT